MAKKDNSLDVTRVSGIPLPDYMQDEKILGTETLAEFVIPPRIKIVQKQASDDLLDKFGPGDVILTPTNVAIVSLPRDEKGRSDEDALAQFNFVPLFFYAEWATWNPIALKNTEPMIRYRTTDPTDPIVAKSKNKSLREEIIPGTDNLKMRHVEHLNYIVMLVDHELEGTPSLITFAKGEWLSGSKLASLIKMRQAALYGCVFTATVAQRTGILGSWYGLDIANPSKRVSWVDKDQYELNKALHLQFVEHHKKSRLKADLDDSGDETPPPVSSESAEF